MPQSISDPDVMKVWATIFMAPEKIGLRTENIVEKTRLSPSNVNCALSSLVDLGFAAYKMLQTGTGGTTDKFFSACEGVTLVK